MVMETNFNYFFETAFFSNLPAAPKHYFKNIYDTLS